MLATYNAEIERGNIRRETLNGRDYVVVPTIALVEGVLQAANSDSPELVLAEEFAAPPESWNGRPVTLSHPRRNGEFVSANNTDVYEREKLGEIFNSELVEGTKLRVEAWLDVDRVNSAGEKAMSVLERLESGDIVEVSTGYFNRIRPAEGEYNGKRYNGRQEAIKPDHLALLADQPGACSVEDGCGAGRMNQSASCGCAAPEPVSADTGEGARDDAVSTNEHSRLVDVIVNAAKALGIYEEVEEEPTANRKDKDDKRYSEREHGDKYKVKRRIKSTTTQDVYETVDSEGNMNEQVPYMVNSLIANEATKWGEGDREYLSSLEADVLEKMVPVEAAEAEADPAPAEAPATFEDWLASAPSEYREVMNESLDMHRKRKGDLVSNLKANSRCEYAEDELKAMSLRDLERLSKIANVPDYSGQGGPRMNVGEDNAVPPMPQVFESK